MNMAVKKSSKIFCTLMMIFTFVQMGFDLSDEINKIGHNNFYLSGK